MTPTWNVKGRHWARCGAAHGMARVPDQVVQEIVARWRAGEKTQKELAAELATRGFATHMNTVQRWCAGTQRELERVGNG